MKKKKTSRRRLLLKRYGITEEQYELLLKSKKNGCWICGRHHLQFKKRLCVDHNHKTGEIRGLLCIYCNRRVVGRHTDGNLLIKAGEYLNQGTGLFVPKRKKR